MRNVIFKSVELPATADKLFEMYLDSTTHTAITGLDASVSAENGSAFQAFGGLLTGKMLQVVKPRLIVQAWRSVSFHETDPDSILILSFSDEGSNGRIDLVHLDVPDHDYDGVTQGWDEKYFEPWRAYLENR